MNDCKRLHNSAYSAPDHHSLKTHTPKTRLKYHENIGYFVRFAWAIACHRVQSIFNNITRHAIAVLGEFQGKTKKAGDPAQDRSHLPRSHILSKRQRDVVTFPAGFKFTKPFFVKSCPVTFEFWRGLLVAHRDMAIFGDHVKRIFAVQALNDFASHKLGRDVFILSPFSHGINS